MTKNSTSDCETPRATLGRVLYEALQAHGVAASIDALGHSQTWEEFTALEGTEGLERAARAVLEAK